MYLYFKTPIDLTKREFDGIFNLIKKGGEVNEEYIKSGLKRAELIGYYVDNDKVISVGVVKNPHPVHKSDIFEKSKTILNEYKFEIGYFSTDELYQGEHLASKIFKKLCNKFKLFNIFATTRVSNIGMKKILENNKFEATGKSFENNDKTDYLLLYVKSSEI